jgi:ABC-type Fe3+ transport system permease subunit
MRRAFRIVAAVLSIVTIGLSLPFAVRALPGEADRIHRFLFDAGTFGSGVLLGVSLLACARRPEDRSPFWVAVARWGSA